MYVYICEHRVILKYAKVANKSEIFIKNTNQFKDKISHLLFLLNKKIAGGPKEMEIVKVIKFVNRNYKVINRNDKYK